jgi:phage baseplate assembly protein gpV
MVAIKAQINSNNSSGPRQVSVTVPSASAAQTFKSLNDVNATSLEDGALIQYDSATDKFVTKTTIETNTGTLRFNGGNF